MEPFRSPVGVDFSLDGLRDLLPGLVLFSVEATFWQSRLFFSNDDLTVTATVVIESSAVVDADGSAERGESGPELSRLLLDLIGMHVTAVRQEEQGGLEVKMNEGPVVVVEIDGPYESFHVEIDDRIVLVG